MLYRWLFLTAIVVIALALSNATRAAQLECEVILERDLTGNYYKFTLEVTQDSKISTIDGRFYLSKSRRISEIWIDSCDSDYSPEGCCAYQTLVTLGKETDNHGDSGSIASDTTDESVTTRTMVPDDVLWLTQHTMDEVTTYKPTIENTAYNAAKCFDIILHTAFFSPTMEKVTNVFQDNSKPKDYSFDLPLIIEHNNGKSTPPSTKARSSLPSRNNHSKYIVCEPCNGVCTQMQPVKVVISVHLEQGDDNSNQYTSGFGVEAEDVTEDTSEESDKLSVDLLNLQKVFTSLQDNIKNQKHQLKTSSAELHQKEQELENSIRSHNETVSNQDAKWANRKRKLEAREAQLESDQKEATVKKQKNDQAFNRLQSLTEELESKKSNIKELENSFIEKLASFVTRIIAIEGKEESLLKQEQKLKEKEELLSNQEQKLKEKEELLSNQEQKLKEKEELLSNQEQKLKEKEELLSNQEQKLKEKEELLSNQKQELEEEEELLLKQGQEIVEKEDSLSKQEQEIVEKEESLSNQEQKLKEREKSLLKQEQELKEKEKSLSEREQRILYFFCLNQLLSNTNTQSSVVTCPPPAPLTWDRHPGSSISPYSPHTSPGLMPQHMMLRSNFNQLNQLNQHFILNPQAPTPSLTLPVLPPTSMAGSLGTPPPSTPTIYPYPPVESPFQPPTSTSN